MRVCVRVGQVRNMWVCVHSQPLPLRNPRLCLPACATNGILCGREDNPRYNIIDKHLKEATAFLEPFVARDGVVLVHCHQGINRSAALSIAFLMLREHWPLPELLRHAFAQRPRLLTNLGFRKQLVKLAIEHNLLAVPIEHAPTPSNAARWSELGGHRRSRRRIAPTSTFVCCEL